jgi:hypothetical protein
MREEHLLAASQNLYQHLHPCDMLDGLASTFFAEAQNMIETPGSSSAIPDFLDPLTEGPRPADLEKMLKFGAALAKVAAEDPAIHKVMVEVEHLLKPSRVTPTRLPRSPSAQKPRWQCRPARLHGRIGWIRRCFDVLDIAFRDQ